VPVPEEERGETTSAPSDLLVAPQRHLVYVGGSYLSGMGSGPFRSSPYLYAFDTRTGEVVWSETGPEEPGMSADYRHLATGPNGSLIAVQTELVGEQHNTSDSYAAEVVSFDASGRVRWRWTDDHAAHLYEVARAGDVFTLVGESYPDGWARTYMVGLDVSTGAFEWRDVSSDGTQHLLNVSVSRDDRTLYLGGVDGHETGSRAMLRAVSADTGDARWTRWYGKPVGNPETDDLVYDAVTRVVTTRTGPCITGAHDGRRAGSFEPVLPDDGFVGCYSPRGKRLWLDGEAGGHGRVLVAAGGRLLWAGRQEVSRAESSEEILRFAIRSLADGRIRHSSSKTFRAPNYDSSDPLHDTRGQCTS
jgi:outer membrane protein assembly factor BamB